MLATIGKIWQALDKLLEMTNTGYMPIIKAVTHELHTLNGRFEM
jgi:hypothetical protein